jgi:hypothetical protein
MLPLVYKTAVVYILKFVVDITFYDSCVFISNNVVVVAMANVIVVL